MGADVCERKTALQCVHCGGRLLGKRIAVIRSFGRVFTQQPPKNGLQQVL